MANRLVSVDDNFDFPDAVVQRRAAHLRNPRSTEGVAVGSIAAGVAKTQSLLQSSLPYAGPLGILRAALALMDTDSPTIGGRVSIGFAGSSTTAGHTTPVGKRWIDHLAAKVTSNPVITDADAYNKTLPPGINFINAGVNGTNATNYLHGLRAERLASTKPRLIVHNIGSNDFINAYTLAQYEESLREVITRLDSLVQGPVAHLLVHSFERYDFTPTAKTWDQYREILMKLALERPDNVAFLDLSETFKGLRISKGDPLGLMMADRLHLNDYGHYLYADLMGSALGLTGPVGASISADAPGVPPVVPEFLTVASDNFTRADGPLGTTPTGAKTWTAGQGTVAIVKGKATATAVSSAAGLPSGAGATVETGFTDGVVTTNQTEGVNQGPLFRANADGAGYYFMYSASGVEYRVGTRNAAGGFTKLLGTGTSVAHAPTSKMTVELKGTSITCKLNGATILQVTDSTFTGTRHGVVFADMGRSLDGFQFDRPATA